MSFIAGWTLGFPVRRDGRKWTGKAAIGHAATVCGRYALSGDPSLIAETYNVIRESGYEEPRPSYNIAPTQKAPVVGLHDGARVLRLNRWGLIPSWAKDMKIGAQCINARGETIAVKPAFRAAFKKRRCLVPASGFFEWRREGKVKIPQYIHPVDGQLMAFAGLWEMWKDPAGEEVRTYTIVTTTPNALVAPIHDRMPVILPRERWDAWLDAQTPVEEVQAMIAPECDGVLEAYAVSRRVNSPAANDAELIRRVEADE